MIVGVVRESYPEERRVALVPSAVPVLAKNGMEVLVERGAGSAAGFDDAAYEDMGARLVVGREELFAAAHIIAQVRSFGANPEMGSADLGLLRSGQVVVGTMNPLGNPDSAPQLADAGVTAFALELLPRVSRAQPMDVLSSMATVAGYKAVLIAADTLDKMCPLLMTAAGTIRPARFLVVGAGVAGLQAIATAHRLGAAVQAYDVRPAARDQVESLGAKFLELELDTEGAEGSGGYAEAMGEDFYRRQRELMTKVIADCNAVVTTAAVPGQRAPILVTGEMVKGMRPGSVVVDLAAEGGGNCELTRPGETVEIDGVKVIGPVNLPATIPSDASQMYSRNVTAFLCNLVHDGALNVNQEDPIIHDSLVAYRGEVVNERIRELLALPRPEATAAERSST